MTPDQYKRLNALTKKYKISFDGNLPQLERRAWPLQHEKIFLDVQKLGKAVFADYSESSVIDSLSKPWKASTRRRTKLLADKASLCREENRNEAGWRFAIEPEIMARFTVEVACPNCRKRLWRSEIEVTLDGKEEALKSLEQRRRARAPCTCVSVTRGEDYLDLGLNPIFSDRVQQVIQHDASLQLVLGKKEEPDRVVGLQETRNFSKLLETIDDCRKFQLPGVCNETDLKATPFCKGGRPLLFPFLVLEAKSEKGRDYFGAIRTQTAFSVRTLLKMQADLQLATMGQSSCLGGPLVWFLANKGAVWRVSAGYVDVKGQTSYYRIVDVWSGDITCKDNSLSLLLIVDYIFDWARDKYRPEILSDLKILSGRDTASLAGDSDIFSMANPRIMSWRNRVQSEEVSVFETRSEGDSGIPQSLLALDSPDGVIRHASFIQSLLLGLYITSNNLESLLLSFPTADKAQRFAREALKLVKYSSRTTAKVLDALEAKWTGNYRPPEGAQDPQALFYVVYSLSAYMLPLWDQVREFSYLAIAEDAINLLFGHAKFSKPVTILPEEHPIIGLQALESFFDRVQRASIVDNLRAAILSASLVGTASAEYHIPEWTVENVSGTTLGFKHQNSGLIRSILCRIYVSNKSGRREPSETFLRISKRHDKQDPEAASSFIWPVSEDLPTIGDGVLLASTRTSVTKVKDPHLCFYIIDTSSEIPDVWTIVQLIQEAASHSTCTVTCRDLKPEAEQYAYNKIGSRWKLGVNHKDINKWFSHLVDIAKSNRSPQIPNPIQAQQASDSVQGTSLSASLAIDEHLVNTSNHGSTSPVRLGSDGGPDVDVVVQTNLARGLDPKNHAHGTAPRKRHADSIDESQETVFHLSKRVATALASDELIDKSSKRLASAFGSDHLIKTALSDNIRLKQIMLLKQTGEASSQSLPDIPLAAIDESTEALKRFGRQVGEGPAYE